MNFSDALSDARRKSLLMGSSLTPAEVEGMSSGWFDSASSNSNKKRAQWATEKMAQDKLDAERADTINQMKTAKEASGNQGISNVVNSAVQTLGMDFIKAKPGESMISKGWEMGKQGVGKAIDLFSPGTSNVMKAAPVINPSMPFANFSNAAPVDSFTGTLSGNALKEAGNYVGQGVSEVPGYLVGQIGGQGTLTGAMGEAALPASQGVGSLMGSAGSALSIAAPWYAAAKLGGTAIGGIVANNPQVRDTPLGLLGDGLEKPVTGVEKSIAERIISDYDKNSPIKVASDIGISTLHPSSLIQSAGEWFGGIFKDAGCIIVTACTSSDSYEVGVARRYRDEFLDKDQLRGYYILAERVVPVMEKNEKAKNLIKKMLVIPLIRYGEYSMGLKVKRCSITDYIISKLFLGVIKTIGLIIPHYIRQNGEVY
jgi:hypothetical protein